MNWLVTIGRAAFRTLTCAALVLASSNAFVDPVQAMAAAQPQLSLTCQFNSGPRAGQVQSHADASSTGAMPIGAPCTDGQGSIGVAIPDPSVPPRVPVAPPSNPAAPPTSFTCRFNNGPRAGQVQSYAGVTGMQPMPAGARCTDGLGSTGAAIPDPSVQPALSSADAPAMSSTCQFDNGPRAGQVQSYAGVTGMQAMPIDAPCTDGRGSTGVAVPDSEVQAPAPVQPPPIPAAPAEVIIPPPAAGDQGSACESDAPREPTRVRCASGDAYVVPRRVRRRAAIRDAAVGAKISGLGGAVWADPDNSGYVTGYTYKGRYHRGLPGGYDPARHAVVTGEVSAPLLRPSSGALPPSAGGPAGAVVGAPVSGLPGAVWADADNDGVVDGYFYEGRYQAGLPAGKDGSKAPPPPPMPPRWEQSGERG